MNAIAPEPAVVAGPPAPGLPAELTDRVAAVSAEHLDRTDRDAVFPVEALDEMRRTGLLGLLVPVEYGGLGGSLRDMIEACMSLGRIDMSVAMIFGMHCQQVAAVVSHGSERLRTELLPRIAEGKIYLASVTTEAGKGGHLLTAESALDTSGDALDVDRFAPIVTGGAHADGFLVTMLAPGARSPNQVSLVYAHRDQLTIEQTGDWQPLGMRASHSVALRLRGRVPEHHVVGVQGGFRTVVTSVFGPMAHLSWSASWLGTAAGALSRVVRMLRSPENRGRVDLGSELLLIRLSQARRRLDTVHALLAQTERTVSQSPDLSLPKIQLQLNALKITAAEECFAVVDGLVDAVGMRHGYLKGSPTRLEHALRDLRSASLNYSNDRLHLADGKLALLDPEVRFV
ncbi:Acyl-CoA dehydrogenase [Streptomyces sp. 3213]|uniref:acyl-CoA dehydrogenase family protein n=1 Tax=Streptomyces sp. 3213.3 TaxID=1855348 RepID=UPI00089680E6|nr:acyl-CoA dehydrogenase family protein [Streptomyces sp. 3213.3]SEC38509.1 Acyl-CoA dehydrogenase [Streptomyces sp. 3213] [Streptomyces sp. 3213.3]